jgi:hypothetical protein
MRRREFIAGVGGCVIPSAVWEQPTVLPVIGFLSGASEAAFADRVLAFSEGLQDEGLTPRAAILSAIKKVK